MKNAHTLAMDAANRMVRIVEGLLSRSHILHCPIHIVPALFAAMGMQAVDICSGQSILEQLAVVKVRLAMIALRELQSTWPVSGWIFRLFSKIVRRIRNGDELLPNEPVNASPVQTKDILHEGEIPTRNHIIDPPTFVNDKTHDADANAAQLYMSNQAAARYVSPEAATLGMPMSYPADWQTIFDDGAWADFDYEF